MKDSGRLPSAGATDERGERALSGGLAALFGLIALLAGLDVAADLREGTTVRHVLVEGAVLAAGLAGVVWQGLRFRALAAEGRALLAHTGELEARLAQTRAEADAFRREAADLIAGLSGAIDRQLEKWGLSAAEKEVALLLLKGLSHKDIGALREVNETTVRQQARALYRKAGLAGRADLAAFFLEDLLGPRAA